MNSDTDQGSVQSSWMRTNQGVGVLITVATVVLLAYLTTQDWVYQQLRDGFHLGTFTLVSAIAILVCGISLIIDKRKKTVEEDLAKARPIEFVYAVIMLVICYVYYELAWRVDYLLVTPAFLFGGMYILGVRPVYIAAITAVVTTVVLFGLFYLIGLDLPSFLTPA